MARNKDQRPDPSSDKRSAGNSDRNPSKDDIEDSQRDKDRLQPDESTIDLPDVKDIPGQEFIHVPRMGEMADTTISSDDEEGAGLFDDDEDDETSIEMGTESDVSGSDREMFRNMDNLQGTGDDIGVARSQLDETDFEGDKLNEKENVSGSDLDVPGAEADDTQEEIGAEDEENNQYSRGSDRNDNMNEGR